MPLRQHSLVFLTTTLLVTLTSQSSLAFTITPDQPGDSDRTYKYEEYYENRQGVTRLDAWPDLSPGKPFPPDPRRLLKGQVLEIEPGGTDGLRDLLNARFGQTWEFIPKGNLQGSFNIENYFACGSDFACRHDGIGVGSAVGAFFQLNYISGEGDPTGNTVHWIQRVMANYSEGQESDQVPIDRIDVPLNAITPYYDDYVRRANSTLFFDLPYVQDPLIYTNHYFYAETYLVNEILGGTTDPDTGIVKRKVEIYSGVRWGWENTFTPKPTTKKFSDSLGAGEQDNFRLDKLTPGANFLAWINNDLPSNRCNPNTYLSAYSDDGSFYSSDNDSSFLGDGFASALTGTLSDDGTLNLTVGAVGGRGEDRGNYELYVDVSDNPSPLPPPVSVGGSGGGGFGNEGRTQQNPILPTAVEQGWQVFRNVPSCRWYDPPTTYGFEFQTLEDTLFTEILDFPVGDDNLFTVSIGDTILGEFGPGQSVDFVSLFGSGVSNFKITGIDSLFGDTEETAFPIQLAFNNRVGSFKMRPLSETPNPQSVPESSSFIGLLALGAWSAWSVSSLKKRK